MIKPASFTGEERIVKIRVGPVRLEGNLIVPEKAYGVVVFVHESGSNRFNPTNRYLAKRLQKVGIATLLFDILSTQEAEIDKIARHMRFDVDLMASRTRAAAEWIGEQPKLQDLPVGYFGCGRGAAAALIAASEHPDRVDAVVSHGGRLDLAQTALDEVKAPTLLLVGRINSLLKIHGRALTDFSPDLYKKLVVFERVSYFWDDPETLEKLSTLTREWFQRYFGHGSRGDVSQHTLGLVSV